MRDRVCYECADLHPMPLHGKCHIFCSRKAVQSGIYKIAVRYDRQNIPILSVKPLSDCHDSSGDMRRYKASYNSACIAADGHELLL